MLNDVNDAPADGDDGSPYMTCRPGGLTMWQRARLFRHIDIHLAERITRDQLAGLVCMSAGNFSRRFKLSTGISPRQYIARKRAEMGRRMLESTREPLSQIAVACGLCDQAHFCRLFRRTFGVSPAAWRRARIQATVQAAASRANRAVDPVRHA